MGHGRSAAIVCAMLVRLGEAASVEDAERFLQARRPGVRLSAGQRSFAARLASS